MREILFRGKRTDNGEWIEGYLVEKTIFSIFDTHLSFVIYKKPTNIYHEEYREIDPSTVGQYTGLTDKNGVKIFEGDIVQHGNLVVEVAYIEKYTRFAGKRKGCTMAMFDWKSCEVIGNIYDNPELLEAENVLPSKKRRH